MITKKGINNMEYIVIENKGFESERIWYCGELEIEAFRKYIELEGKNRCLVKGTVKRSKIMGVDFIFSYEVNEIIK